MIGHLFKICDVFYVCPYNSLFLLVYPDTSKYFDIGELMKFESFQGCRYRSWVLLVENHLETARTIVDLQNNSHLLINLANCSAHDHYLSNALPALKLQVVFGPYRAILEKFESDRCEDLLSPGRLFLWLIVSTIVAISISASGTSVSTTILRIEKAWVAVSELCSHKS